MTRVHPRPDLRMNRACVALGGNREPGCVAVATVGGGLGLFEQARGEAVASFGAVLDAPLPDEILQDSADGLVPGCGEFADLALRQRSRGFGERLEDAPFGGFGSRRGASRGRLAQAEGGHLPVLVELNLDVVETAAAPCSTVMRVRRSRQCR